MLDDSRCHIVKGNQISSKKSFFSSYFSFICVSYKINDRLSSKNHYAYALFCIKKQLCNWVTHNFSNYRPSGVGWLYDTKIDSFICTDNNDLFSHIYYYLLLQNKTLSVQVKTHSLREQNKNVKVILDESAQRK